MNRTRASRKLIEYEESAVNKSEKPHVFVSKSIEIHANRIKAFGTSWPHMVKFNYISYGVLHITFDWMYRLQNTWITVKINPIYWRAAAAAAAARCCYLVPVSCSLSLLFSKRKCETKNLIRNCIIGVATTSNRFVSEVIAACMSNRHSQNNRHMEGNEKCHNENEIIWWFSSSCIRYIGWFQTKLPFSLSVSLSPKAKSYLVCVIRAKKMFLLNQVNDECKVGHFADTYKYIVACILRVVCGALFTAAFKGDWEWVREWNGTRNESLDSPYVFVCMFLFVSR